MSVDLGDIVDMGSKPKRDTDYHHDAEGDLEDLYCEGELCQYGSSKPTVGRMGCSHNE